MGNEIIFEYRLKIFYLYFKIVFKNELHMVHTTIFSRVSVCICTDYGNFVLVYVYYR